MQQATEGQPPGPNRGGRLRAGLVAAGAALGLTLAGLGMAAAQTESPTTTAPAARPDDRGPGNKGPGGRHGMGMGIHGEFTARAPGGGYQTLATQVGEVTGVSSSSITVKSEDGFSREYGVDDNTMVNAGNEGIADVKQGDQVRVMAVVKDGKANAVDVRDVTKARELRDRWAPPRRDRQGD